uniref:Oxysterol-binding protein n=1 Tax=Sphenodon punctatus TaxID=8508 RepID=A0A8D0L5Q4_SPHPU
TEKGAAEAGEIETESREQSCCSCVVTNSDELHLLTPGKMSQRQLTPTKEMLQPSLSPGTVHSHGFDRGKDDASQSKEDSSYSMSKSKSESKLYNGSEKDISSSSTKLTKKESLKVQKKNYREEKKRATKELLSTITDPSVIVMADWLKIRGTLKSWTKLWCVLKPGVLLIYKTPKNGQWVGTVLLNACELIERPSKKDGFCEAVGSITQPLPSSYLIIRAASESDGRCWMDALELALKCSSLLKRTMMRDGKEHDLNTSTDSAHVSFYGLLRTNHLHSGENFPDTDTSERQDDFYVDPDSDNIKETTYLEQIHEELGEAWEASQTEIVSEENKSLIWTLLKQVRPGMDLSKVVLPTFILETRSFLDKLSDYYYHADFLSEDALEENAYNRMKKVVKWYLSGFYKKPQGLKKPYNPILGETFRCMWIHPRTSSKTYYIAEQVSHHPPVSAFYVSNRKDGFCLNGSILAKSKFYGNSLSAILDGEGRLMFLNRGEEYVMTMPYAHCKGILYGTLTLELGGIVSIACEKTGYSAVIEFKLKPFLGNDDNVNQILGKIKLGKEVLATLEGHWDSEVIISDKKTDVSETFWNPTAEIRQRRLRRFTVKFEEQDDFESEKLWQNVTQAITNKDQTEATKEKCVLEDAQRKAAKDRKAKSEDWACKLFEQDSVTGEWRYKFADTRPWDPLNDMIQFEKDGAIRTKVRHRTPMVSVPQKKRKTASQSKKGECGFSSPEPDNQDSSGSEARHLKHSTRIRKKGTDLGELQSSIESIKETQEDIRRDITALRNRMASSSPTPENNFLQFKHYVFIFFLILLQLLINFLFK